LQLDRAFPSTKITVRGNRIKISGPQKEVATVTDILKEMVRIAQKKNYIQSSDLRTLLALAGKIEPGSSSENRTIQFDNDTGDIILHTHTGEAITAKTPGQRNIVRASVNNDILFAIGPAGTGKTYTSVALAVRALKERKVKKIILARPAVEAGENLGFLPGDLKEKIDPYLRPLYDALEEMIEFDKLEFQLAKNIIEIAPLAYMRGTYP
jgi:phosphate starvation-inducible protein PhoH and related proteins